MQTNKANLANWLDVWAKLLYGLMDVGGGPSQRVSQSHLVLWANRGKSNPPTAQDAFRTHFSKPLNDAEPKKLSFHLARACKANLQCPYWCCTPLNHVFGTAKGVMCFHSTKFPTG